MNNENNKKSGNVFSSLISRFKRKGGKPEITRIRMGLWDSIKLGVGLGVGLVVVVFVAILLAGVFMNFLYGPPTDPGMFM